MGLSRPEPLLHPATASPTLRDPVLKAHAGLCGVLPPPGTEQLLHEGLALLLLVAAAAGDPLGEGVERLLICHGWGLCSPILTPSRGLPAPSSDSQQATKRQARDKWPRHPQ
jgi:hypothetical protein